MFLKKKGATTTIQKHARARVVRQQLADMSKHLVDEENSKRTLAQQRRRAATAARERREKEGQAARCIGRRARVYKAKKEVHGQRKMRSMEHGSANNLLAQVSGVRVLASLLMRYRQSRAVMWRVFEHAVLGWYEHAAAHFGADLWPPAVAPPEESPDMFTPSSVASSSSPARGGGHRPLNYSSAPPGQGHRCTRRTQSLHVRFVALLACADY